MSDTPVNRRLTWRAKLPIALAAFIALAGLIYYWLLFDNRMPTTGAYPIDIAAIRAEAARIPGDLPKSIEVETVSHSATPRIAMVAGTDWSQIDLVRVSYRLVFTNGSIIIDTGFDAPAAKLSKVDSFDDAAFHRVLAAMNRATHIVVTHEHVDHLGGLLTSPNLKQLMSKAILNPQQFEESDRIAPLHWPAGVRAGYKPVVYDRPLAIAPGVVLIRAPGHTPGSQMIYVRRADGQEYLFMGDTASTADNVRLERIRSHLVTDFISHDDRTAVLLQTRALHELSVAEPALALVPGHDGPAIEAFERRGLLTRGFHL